MKTAYQKLLRTLAVFAFISVVFSQNSIKYPIIDDGSAITLGMAVEINAAGQINPCEDNDPNVIGIVTAIETSTGTDYYLVSSSDVAIASLPADVLASDDLTTAAGGGLRLAGAGETIVATALEDGDGNPATLERIMIAVDFPRGTSMMKVYDDFLTASNVANTNTESWVDITAGGGATTVVPTNAANHPGIISWSASAIGDRRGLYQGVSGIRLGGGTFRWTAIVFLPTLSAAGNRYVFRIGLGDNIAGAEHTDGVYFEYSDNLSAGDWRGVTANNNVRTYTDLGLAVAANTWYKLQFDVNSNGSSVRFYIDGVYRATVNANIPTAAGRECGANGYIVKSTGGGARIVYIDLIDFTYGISR